VRMPNPENMRRERSSSDIASMRSCLAIPVHRR